ncbi:MAG TPA: DsrE family protein, partial [Puia sp.]|nr:DsrE family protein [Puia sp.]
ALNVYLQDSLYKKKFKVSNPNLELLKQFSALGVKLVACGQAMHFFEFEKKDFVPDVRVALSAKVVLSTYQLKGFVLYQVTNED